MNYTREQEMAVRTRNQDILVSAGAGAGKTRVLVNRMVEMLLDEEHPLSADEFLVMTFTNAAAAEMKERITKELNERLKLEPENRHLRRQIRLIRQADISTVHSFCNRLLRTHFQELGLDPSFRIGEEGELFLLRRQVMEDLMEEAYAEGRESFYQLVEAYAPGRDDGVLEEMIEGLYTFSRGFPDSAQWFKTQLDKMRALTQEDKMEDSLFVKQQMEILHRNISYLRGRLEEVWEWFPEDGSVPRYRALLLEDEALLEQLNTAQEFKEMYRCFSDIKIADLPRTNKEEKAWEFLPEAQEIHREIRETLYGIRDSVFFCDPQSLCRENQTLLPLMEELIRLVQRMEEQYSAEKRERNVYDFDDLEHLALHVLVKEYDAEGNPVPTETARELGRKYKAIFVDEYQDTNLVQEMLLRVLSLDLENHVFVVGDVKQSIYRFRQARPDLFLRRYEDYQTQQGEGLCIELRDNFRSAPGVLSFCNDVFSRLMTKEFGGVDYNQTVELRVGKGGPMEGIEEKSECLLLSEDQKGEIDWEYDSLLAETAMIARKMKELTEEGYDYGDMVILLRSGADQAETMAEYLKRFSIPAVCGSRTGYFHTREVEVILNYLSVVDNVYQDIPMASVLLSPIGGFSEEDLVRLKIQIHASMREQYSLYDLMMLYTKEGDDPALKTRLKVFLDLLQEFRQEKKEVPLHRLIWDIYQKTGFYYDVLLMPDGENRRENLHLLLQKAEDYEKTVFKGLFYFIRYMEQLRSYEVELNQAQLEKEDAGKVQIMTIHKSKGLEFPIVFVSGLSRKFYLKDQYRPMLCDPELGLGLEYTDLATRTHHSSLMKRVIQDKMHQDTLEEELRILYVAMTRAQRRLILTGVTGDSMFKKHEKNQLSQAEKLAAGSFMDWMIPILDQVPQYCHMVQLHDLDAWMEEMSEESEGENVTDLLTEWPVTEDISPVEKAFEREYPYQDAVSRKRKYSVSELKKIAMKNLPGEETVHAPEVEGGREKSEEEVPVPSFIKEKKEEVSSAAKGTMVHKMMELLSFGEIQTKKELYDAMTGIEKQYQMDEMMSMAYVYRGVEGFLFSEEGKQIRQLDREHKLKKELPFTIGLPVAFIEETEHRSHTRVTDQNGEEMVVVQGVIDLCAELEDGLWLLDYKTDRIRPGEEHMLLDRYQKQMLYYKTALEMITGKTVKCCQIYSFALQAFVTVDLK